MKKKLGADTESREVTTGVGAAALDTLTSGLALKLYDNVMISYSTVRSVVYAVLGVYTEGLTLSSLRLVSGS